MANMGNLNEVDFGDVFDTDLNDGEPETDFVPEDELEYDMGNLEIGYCYSNGEVFFQRHGKRRLSFLYDEAVKIFEAIINHISGEELMEVTSAINDNNAEMETTIFVDFSGDGRYSSVVMNTDDYLEVVAYAENVGVKQLIDIKDYSCKLKNDFVDNSIVISEIYKKGTRSEDNK